MKVAISCDHLIQRTHFTSILETFLYLYPEAELFTIVHKAGNIIGPLEHHKIQSSYLTHLINDENDFFKKAYLIPGALSKLNVSCSFDLLINISNGYSHGVACCDEVPQITYLYDFYPHTRRPKYLRERFFKSYLESWSLKRLSRSKDVWVANQELYDFFKDKHPSVKLIRPFIKVTDYPLFPEGQRKMIAKDMYLINANQLDRVNAKSIMNFLDERKLKYHFIGQDDHLNDLKTCSEDKRFFGNRCSGELAPILSAAKGVIDFASQTFPELALCAMASGTPVFVRDNEKSRDILGDYGVYYFNSLDELTFLSNKKNEFSEELEPMKIRAQAMKFHDLKFKQRVDREIKNFLEL